MPKTLKFSPNLIPGILDGSKTSTWRLWDDKNLTAGDRVVFLDKETGKKFATAELTRVYTTTLGKLTAEEKEGHEEFASDKDMYKKFEGYYNRSVGPDTPVTIVLYKIIKKD